MAVPRRQVRALLYRLVVLPYAVPRSQLCLLFWPDLPDADARRHLTHLITALRRALPDPALLHVIEEHVALDPGRVWSDTVRFQELYAGQHAGSRRENYEQAVGLYRGPFLAGFFLPDNPEFEAWVTQEQRAWERRYLEMLEALIALCLQGESETQPAAYQAAIGHALRYLATDELAEDVHRQLIELYALVGNRSAALRQFEQCVTVLERELGVSPLPETQAVYRAVLQGRTPTLPAPPDAAGEPPVPAPTLPLALALPTRAGSRTTARPWMGCATFASACGMP